MRSQIKKLVNLKKSKPFADKAKLKGLFATPPCGHLAIIMDGNGRWAKQKGWPRHFGHQRGVKALYQTIKDCSDLNIPYLTVFAFSTETGKGLL